MGCNLCMYVCPVDGCITMERIDNGKPHVVWADVVWADDPRNPASRAQAAG